MNSTHMDNLLRFTIHDDCIESDNTFFYFYRYYPPSTDIMTAAEIELEIAHFAKLLDSMEQPFCMFATDKVEDLSDIRGHYASLNPKYDAYTSEIISRIDDTESSSAAVQRAFYFILPCQRKEEVAYNRFAGKGYYIDTVTKNELATLLRNFYVREFVTTPIHTLEAEILQDKKVAKQLAKRPELMSRELERRLLPRRMDFLVNSALANGAKRKTVMVRNLPQKIDPCAMLQAATMRGTSFMMRFTPMNTGSVKRMTDAALNNKKVQIGSAKATNIIEANEETKSLLNFYKSISSSKMKVFFTSIYIELYEKSDKEMAAKLEKLMECFPTGVTLDHLQREQKHGFLSVQPLGKDYFLPEANNLPSTTAAALYPFGYSSRLDAKGMYLGITKRGGAFFLDLLRRDKGATNSNFTIIGDSGQGKSTLMKKIIENLTLFGVSCFTLDPENEYGTLFRNLGGTVYKAIDGQSRINPFDVRWLYRADDELDDDDVMGKALQNKSMFFQHLSWLKDFFRVLFPGLDDLDAQALMVLVQEVYAAKGIDAQSEFQMLQAVDYPTMSEVYEYIETYDCSTNRLISEDIIRRLLLRLRECYDGALSLIFNGHTNIKNADMICFELAELLEGSKDRTQAVLFNITTWIWTQIMKRDRKIAFNLDELYLFLQNPIMVKYISSFVKRVRKYGSLMGIATQQLADCLRPDISTYTTALFNNSTHQFFFHPGMIDADLVQEKLKLTPGEMETIAKPNQGHCLVKTGTEKYYIHVDRLPYEIELFGTGGGK